MLQKFKLFRVNTMFYSFKPKAKSEGKPTGKLPELFISEPKVKLSLSLSFLSLVQFE